MTKEQVLTALNNLPDEFETSELFDKIECTENSNANEIPPDEMEEIMKGIERGRKDIREGRYITHEELKEQIKTLK